jgi:hypothetical protein
MKTCHLLFTSFVLSLLLSSFSSARQKEKTTSPAESAASPEMDRLANAFSGDWNTTETMERSEFFPNGGSRHGRAQVRLVAGGTTLVDQVHSDGSSGKLDGLVVIWWDAGAKVYRFFTCFSDPKNSCEVRGTAHWKGDTFVNEYEEMVEGK